MRYLLKFRWRGSLVLIGALCYIHFGCNRKTPPVSRGNTEVASFSEAKREIYRLFLEHQKTFYCGCNYKDKSVDHRSCGYVVKSDLKRAARTEIEHVVPAHAFGHSFESWRTGHASCRDKKGKAYRGRRCAQKVDESFRRMEADLFNLQPVIGEVNRHRSNFSMAVLDGEPREFGRCDVEIQDRKIEPRPGVRGDIARTYLYMDWAYPKRGIISRKNRSLFDAWDRADPVDAWEAKRVRAIENIQGNLNPFVGTVGSSGARPVEGANH